MSKKNNTNDLFEVKGEIGRDGYEYVNLFCIDKKFRKFRKDRVIWYYFNGVIPDDCEIYHNDGNKLNCKIDNLYMAKKTK